MIGRALSEGYRSILPHGVYPAALLFIETPLEEVDVNVHPAKTEVRFRRSAAVADAVRESVRMALAAAGFVRDEATASATAVAGAGTGNERVASNQGDGTTTQMAVAPSTDATKISTPFPVSGPLPAAEPTLHHSRGLISSHRCRRLASFGGGRTLPFNPDPIATVAAVESETEADLQRKSVCCN